MNKDFTVDTVTLKADIRHFVTDNPCIISDRDYIIQNWDITRQDGKLIYYYKHNNINLKYYENFRVLHITFKLSELLGKEIYAQDDCEALTRELESKLFFLKYIDWDNLKLQRIDYKLDYYTPHIALYLKLINKSKSRHYSLKKQDYKYSCYYKSKSKNINIYDKENERRSKNKLVDDSIKDLLRFEVQFKRESLDAQLYKQGTVKNLFNYITQQDSQEHIQAVLKPIIFCGNYYNLYHSRKQLEKFYGTKTVNSLIEFQKQISLQGLDELKEQLSDQSYRNKIIKLNEANVNPIPIPKADKITFLENPIFKSHIDSINKRIA